MRVEDIRGWWSQIWHTNSTNEELPRGGVTTEKVGLVTNKK
jgi:hypothetical protein